MVSGFVLFLIHGAMAAGIFFLARNYVIKLLLKFHAPHDAPVHSRENEKALKTEGLTISWAFAYDLLVYSLLLGQERKFRESIVDLAMIQPGEKVLDVGCGTGSLAIAAGLKAGSSAEIHGIDVARTMIERARRKAINAGVTVDFKTGLVEAIEFPDETFDIVMNSFMVHHLPGDLKSKAFAEMYRVLKPGGRLLIVDFESPKNRLVRMVLNLFAPEEMMMIDNNKLLPLLESAGFISVKKEKTNFRLATTISGIKK